MISGGTAPLIKRAGGAVDILITAVGCEQRSTTLLRSEAIEPTDIFAIVFPGPDTDVYRENVAFITSRNANIIALGDLDEKFRAKLPLQFIQLFEKLKRPLHIGIDVSSMNRTIIATVLVFVFAISRVVSRISTFYLPARFVAPSLEFPAIENIGPVLPELSGFDANPELPFGLIMGMGFEYGVGAGLINRVEPQTAICLRAVGHEAEFEDAVRKANLDFDFGNGCIIGDYNVLDALGSYTMIENLCFAMSKQHRLVFIPLGPKIFATISAICAIKYFNKFALWRVVTRASPLDSVAAGKIVSLSFQPEQILSQRKISELGQLFLSEEAWTAHAGSYGEQTLG